MLTLRYDSSSPRPYPTGEDILEPDTDPVRVWVPNSPLLVLGNSQSPEIEIDLDAARADGIPVYQRKGGGGAVYLNEGCVCVALRFHRNAGWAIGDYFKAGNGLLQSSFFDTYGIRLETRGISDLAHNSEKGERKVVGSSLYMPRHCAVYLASILVDTRLEALDRYLRHPSREPDYRARRTHAEFVVNLADLGRITPPTTAEALRKGAAHPEFRALLGAQD